MLAAIDRLTGLLEFRAKLAGMVNPKVVRPGESLAKQRDSMDNLKGLSNERASSQLSEAEAVGLYQHLVENDFGGYVRAAWPILEPATTFLDNWHIDLIAEYLMLVRRREIRRLIVQRTPSLHEVAARHSHVSNVGVDAGSSHAIYLLQLRGLSLDQT